MSIPFATQTAQGRSKAMTAERLVNLYPEQAPSQSKGPVLLIGTPGFERFGTIGVGPCRAEHVMAGVLYVVSGTELYSVDSEGQGTLLGTIAGTGRVHTADNGTELVLVNSTGTGYVYDGTLATISDPDYQLASSCVFLNQYIVFSKKDSGQFFWSGILNAKTYDALDFATAESLPDNIVELLSTANLLWIFGEKTIEIFYNSGSSAVFERVSGAPMALGAVANTITSLDNTPFWLGDDGIFYRANGYVPVRISTHAIEAMVKDRTNPRAFSYVEEGHRFYVVSYDQGAVVYDTTTELWHERETFTVGRWRGCCYAKAYGKHIVGDYNLGYLYDMRLNVYTDDVTPLQRRAITPFIHNHGKLLSLGAFEVAFESGVGLTSGQGSDPQAMLDWTDDGETWSNELWRSMGKKGERTRRAVWNRLGRFRSRAFRVTVSDPVKVVIIGANL